MNTDWTPHDPLDDSWDRAMPTLGTDRLLGADGEERLPDAGELGVASGDWPYWQLALYARDLHIAHRAERRRAAELEAAYYETVIRLVEACQARNIETGAHLSRMSHYLRALGEAFDWPQERIQKTSAAAMLHDVGKIGIPDAVLHKPGPLDAKEREQMQFHTLIGNRILHGSPSPVIQLAAEIALSHHETWNGTGYPHRLRGSEIPFEAQLVMLADRYDAVRSARPYKPAVDHDTTVDILLSGDERTRPDEFSPLLRELFADLQGDFATIYEEQTEASRPAAPGSAD